VQYILTTLSGVFLMPFVFLALPGKGKKQTCATHSYNNLWCVLLPCVFLAQKQQTFVAHSYNTLGVFLLPYVFLALPGKETADLCNTFLQHPLVCF
jgi:hypothetical protein